MKGMTAPPPPKDNTSINVAFNAFRAGKLSHESMRSLLGEHYGVATGVAQASNQGLGLPAGNMHSAQQCVPNASLQGIGQTPQMSADEFAARAATLEMFGQDEALRAMNPIARERYEAVFKLLGIKLRRINHVQLGSGWLLAQQLRSGKQHRMEWTSTASDPAGSLRLWETVVSEFTDEVARQNGYEIDDYNTTSVG